ncbi:GPI ethanolamine phosphate transferase 3 [Nosema bombycis CQ1]|uniref:GPI ethanolamine phosphate transferase 3 n=1 Tax=Nosema bombycis (strain CQ1 / CVCC 102059) TaxID=578461 RepID=R0M1K8_NOSB1|nr:GPI ethanolamine phosphate transferase 3 [Nosema bombycis CQ1]|eukprot:EOB11879.1 GPI ethanolamine phosphate transferase 3 [Nosema bombycis CQ1]
MSLILKCLSLGIIYFFLTGLFKKPSFTLERNFKPTPNEDPYKKLIYIVLDALRFDYTILSKENNYYNNKMKYYYEILRKANSFHSLSVCGIPTSTTCRITGLLTGSPSNFLEGTKTFLNSKILIDNLIEQVFKRMPVSFYGDGTWLSLFPYLKENSETFDPYTK